MDKLDTDILILLLETAKRPSDIRNALISLSKDGPILESRALDVKIARRLKRLRKGKYVDRQKKNEQNVSYHITSKGRYSLLSDFNKTSMGIPSENINIQILYTICRFKITVVDIMTPEGASLEDYARNLSKSMSDGDQLAEMARALSEDPRKIYEEFGKLVDRYERKKTKLMLARLKQQNNSA